MIPLVWGIWEEIHLEDLEIFSDKLKDKDLKKISLVTFPISSVVKDNNQEKDKI
jgi:hypothetical protein